MDTRFKKVMSGAVGALVLMVSGAGAASSVVSTSDARRGIEYDRFGNVVKTADGVRTNYQQSDLGSADLLSNVPGDTGTGAVVATTETAAEGGEIGVEHQIIEFRRVWDDVVFGSGIGVAGLVPFDIDADGKRELLLDSYYGNYWNILRYNGQNGAYEVIWTSGIYDSALGSISTLAAVDVGPDKKVLVGMSNGKVKVYGSTPLRLITEITVASTPIRRMVLADADNDGIDDLVVATDTAVYLHDPVRFGKKGQLPYGGTGLAVGNVDDDAANEIVLSSGWVLQHDANGTVVEWDNSLSTFGARLGLADVDADGRKEIVAAASWYSINAYDAELKAIKWQVSADLDIGALHLADTDGDGVVEVLYGDGQWGSIHVLDASTGAERWSLANPEHGTTNIAVFDADSDGKLELVWGAGATSSGADHLYVHDVVSRGLEWSNLHIDGPYNAVDLGDVDGDGQQEIVAISFTSNSGYDDGVLSIYDARTYALKWRSATNLFQRNAWTGVHDVKIGDVDGDGAAEIVVATDRLYDGAIYVLDGATHVVEATYIYDSGSPMQAVTIADVDGDGKNDIIAANGKAHTGSPGVFVYVIDGSTGGVKWKSQSLGSGWNGVYALEVGDVDGDGTREIVVSFDYLFVINPVSGAQWKSAENGHLGLSLFDLTGDGRSEIMVGTASGALVSVDGSGASRQTIAQPCTTGIYSVKTGSMSLYPRTVAYACGGRVGIYQLDAAAVAWQEEIGGGTVGYRNNLIASDATGVNRLAVGTRNSVRAYRDSKNSAPTAGNGSLYAGFNATATGRLEAADADGDPLLYVLVDVPRKGSVAIDPRSGEYSFTPARDASGGDGFTFLVTDGVESSDLATMTITINTPPVASDLAVTVERKGTATGTLLATDVNSALLAFEIVSAPASGQVTLDPATGAFTYNASASIKGADQFTFRVFDGDAYSNVATVTVEVLGTAKHQGAAYQK